MMFSFLLSHDFYFFLFFEKKKYFVLNVFSVLFYSLHKFKI